MSVVKSVVLTRQAAAELAEAMAWYDHHRHGLGSELVAEFRAASALLEAHPGGAPTLARGYRRRMLRRFPYGLVYQDSGDSLLVVAFWHSARDPKHLLARLV